MHMGWFWANIAKGCIYKEFNGNLGGFKEKADNDSGMSFGYKL